MNILEDSYSKKVLERLARFQEEEFLTDVILVAGDACIPAHRNVLSSCSEYFRAMFSKSFKESTNKEVTIKDVDGETLRLIVGFCYTGRLKPSNHGMASSLLEAAEYFNLSEAVEICCKFLEESLEPSKCLELLFVADRHNFPVLRDEAFKTIVSNFNEVRRFESFVHLSAEQIGRILQSEELDIDSERDVFDALMDWYNFDKEKRECNFSPLLSLLHLPSLPSSVTLKLILNQKYDYSELMQLIRDSNWGVSPTRRRPKSYGRGLVAMSLKIIEGGGRFLQWMTFDEKSEAWVDAKSLEINHHFGKRLISEGYKMMMGNSVLYLTYSSGFIFKYDLNTEIWDFGHVQRKAFETACIDDSLYIIGGNRTYDTHQSYSDEGTDTCYWPEIMSNDFLKRFIECEKIRFGRTKSGVIVVGKKLYMVGGRDFSDKDVNCVECYDSVANVWSECASLPHAVANPSLASLKGQIYCIHTIFKREGSFSSHLYSLRVCPTSDSDVNSKDWVEMAPQPYPLRCTSSCACNNNLFLAGKRARPYNGIVVMRYIPTRDQWREMPPPPDTTDNFQLVNLPEDPTARNRWLDFICN